MQLDKIRRILMVFLLVVLFYTLNTNEEAFVNTSGKIFLHSADNQQVILGGEVVGFEIKVMVCWWYLIVEQALLMDI